MASTAAMPPRRYASRSFMPRAPSPATVARMSTTTAQESALQPTVVGAQSSAKGEAARSGNSRRRGRGEVTRERSNRLHPPVTVRDPPAFLCRRSCPYRARRGGSRAAVDERASVVLRRPGPRYLPRRAVVHGFERSVIAGSSHRIRQHLVRFLDQSKEGNRTAKVRMDPLDQRTVFCLDLVGRGRGRNPENVVVRVSSHLLIMPPMLCCSTPPIGVADRRRGPGRMCVRLRATGRPRTCPGRTA